MPLSLHGIATSAAMADEGAGSHSAPTLSEGQALVVPRTDDCQYRRIVLSNGLVALLVHDASADKAAAACDVRVLGRLIGAALAQWGHWKHIVWASRRFRHGSRMAGCCRRSTAPPSKTLRAAPGPFLAQVVAHTVSGTRPLSCSRAAVHAFCTEASVTGPPLLAPGLPLQVRVGSLSDPDDVPGLAHFTEHMLFYSSAKYPEEGAYRWGWGEGRRGCWPWRGAVRGLESGRGQHGTPAGSMPCLPSLACSPSCRSWRCTSAHTASSPQCLAPPSSFPTRHPGRPSPLGPPCSKFVSEHGGHTNAYTSNESTNYHFDVNWDALEPALDRWAATCCRVSSVVHCV